MRWHRSDTCVIQQRLPLRLLFRIGAAGASAAVYSPAARVTSGLWSKGMTLARHAGSSGSSPDRSTSNGRQPDTARRARLLNVAPARAYGFDSHAFRFPPGVGA